MLSDVSKSNFKRLAMFCTEKELEDRAHRRKILIESRKRFLEAHKNQLDALIFGVTSQTAIWRVVHNLTK
jgi:hypothetical protein